MRSTIVRAWVPALLILTGIAGCNDEDSVSTQVVLSDDEAASLIGATLAGGQSTYGLSAQVADAALLATLGGMGKIADPGSVAFDTSVTRQWSGTWGNRQYSYSYTFNFSYEFTLGGMTYGYSMHGAYDTPWMASDDTAGAAWTLAGAPGTPFTLNGTYNRWGSQVSKVMARMSFRSRNSMTLADVVIARDTRQIAGGTASGVLEGEATTGHAFTFTYTVTFLGGQQARLVINGQPYDVNLNSGETVRR